MRDSGTPYVCFKDHANRQSMHQSVGTLQSSNLCTEIYEWHSPDQYACCSLASVNLNAYVLRECELTLDELSSKWSDSTNWSEYYDFQGLHDHVKMIVRGLDNIIEINDYPVSECQVGAHTLRPIGIGIQGLADVFMRLCLPYTSRGAEALDIQIHETIYHAALEESCDLAQLRGSFKGFENSPYAHGKIRPDLTTRVDTLGWNVLPEYQLYMKPDTDISHIPNLYNWDEMRERVTHGVRNSLLIALMPTVSTSMIFGNNEMFEPIAGNIYTKGTSSSKYVMTNRYFIEKMIGEKRWSSDVALEITNNRGSVQSLHIPDYAKQLYATVYEIKQSQLAKRCAQRQNYIDQGQSFNVHLKSNENKFLRAHLINSWASGMLTSSYYIRTLPAADGLRTQQTLGQNLGAAQPTAQANAANAQAAQAAQAANAGPVCMRGEDCLSCGS